MRNENDPEALDDLGLCCTKPAAEPENYNYSGKIFDSWYDWRRAVDSIDRIVIYARNKSGDIQPVACYGANDSQTVRFVFTREMIDRLAEITGLTFNDRQRIAQREKEKNK